MLLCEMQNETENQCTGERVAIKKAAVPTSQFVQMGYSPPKKLGSFEDGVDCHCPCHLKYEKVEQHICETLAAL